MKAVGAHDRPREKLQRVGVGALGDNELVAVVLGHGRANASALDLANAVLAASRRRSTAGPGAARRASGDRRHRRGAGRRRSSRRWSWAAAR